MIIKNIQQRFISDDIGQGQFATTFIPRGTLIWHNSGDYKIIPKTNFDTLTTEEQEQALKYGIQTRNEEILIFYGLESMTNHSCHANVLGTEFGLEVAIRDILENEEIANDYGMFELDNYSCIGVCSCQQPNCRTIINRLNDNDQVLKHNLTNYKDSLYIALTLPQQLTVEQEIIQNIIQNSNKIISAV